MRGNVIRTVFSHTGKEIVKGADDKCITKVKTTEDGIKGRFAQHVVSGCNGSNFQFES